MSIKERQTDLWVSRLLSEAGIYLEPQGSSVKEISESLKTASKRGTGKIGYPEYVGVVKDFLIVIEDKSTISNHIKRAEDGTISQEIADVCNYAVNGALFYGLHLFHSTSYKKIIAIGVSGTEKRHRITPIFIGGSDYYTELAELDTFISFSEHNIDSYYLHEVLGEDTNFDKETKDLLRDAAILHDDLHNYGSISNTEKPLLVSGILLSLREIKHKNFSIESLVGDKNVTDGQKIYNAIEANLRRANVSPDVKKDKLLSQFSFIKDNVKINQVNEVLGKTPLKYYTEFLYKSIYHSIENYQSGEDYIGRFYGEFMSYSGGDGQTLGIILTPKHITELFCELLDLQPSDKVLDPCCGTAGFLISAMHYMFQKTSDSNERDEIKRNRLYGIEEQPYMFAIATTNMILRGDGKSNLEAQDFFNYRPSDLQLKGCTVGMMNPPYSKGSKDNPEPYEISFTERLLDSIVERGRVAVIVPQSTITGKTKIEKEIKHNILKKHTLDGVITLNKDTFYGVGTNTCICLFTSGVPHGKNKKSKFINFEDDGYEVSKHIGLLATPSAKDKKQHLLDVWFGRVEAESKFCVETTITADDEWLHSFYYFNDEPPLEEEFKKVIADYITFEVNMISHGRGYLFSRDIDKNFAEDTSEVDYSLTDVEWGAFKIEDVFEVTGTITTHPSSLIFGGDTPRITCAGTNNGLDNFYMNMSTEKGGVLTVDSATEGVIFYHGYDFLATDHVEKISFKDNRFMSKEIGLFLKTIIEQAKGTKYRYGYKFSQTRIRRQIILLPIDQNGDPNWEFMENYVRQEYTKIGRKIYKYYYQ